MLDLPFGQQIRHTLIYLSERVYLPSRASTELFVTRTYYANIVLRNPFQENTWRVIDDKRELPIGVIPSYHWHFRSGSRFDDQAMAVNDY